MGVKGLARRPRTHLAATSLTIVTLAVLAATLVLAVLNTRRTGVSRLGLDAALSAAVLLYAASGRLIASRRPENAGSLAIGIRSMAVGSAFTVKDRLLALAQATRADELMITTMIYDHASRRHSYELLAEAFALPR